MGTVCTELLWRDGSSAGATRADHALDEHASGKRAKSKHTEMGSCG